MEWGVGSHTQRGRVHGVHEVVYGVYEVVYGVHGYTGGVRRERRMKRKENEEGSTKRERSTKYIHNNTSG